MLTDLTVYDCYLFCSVCEQRHATKCRARRIRTVTICGSLGPICRSVITRVTVRARVWVRVRFGLGLRIVVYKLLEKVTKCGSVT